MKVKILKDQLVGFAWREKGEVVDVDPRRAEQMIRDKAAERAEPVDESEVDSPPDEASRRETTRRTGRPARSGPPELTGEVDPSAPAPGETAVKVGSTETAEVKANPDGSLVQVSVEETDPAGAPVATGAGKASAGKGQKLGPGDAK